MKKFLVLLVAIGVVLGARAARAETEAECMGLGLPAALADVLCGDVTASGSITFEDSGDTLRFQEATAGSKCMGSATANGTTAVTVSTTCAKTNARIFITQTSDGTGTNTNDQNGCWVTNIVNGVSFDLDCSDATHNGTFNWIIFHESP